MAYKIVSLGELKRLFDDGTLSEDDGDVILFDKSECTLYTDKDYYYTEPWDEVAWSALSILDIPASGV